MGQAETLIVAIGASNTAGKGVSESQAWPAQLEALLDAKNYDVRIINAGVNGDDIARIRRRLGTAVPKGTRVILFDPGLMNSKKRGVNIEEYMASIQQWVKSRRVKLIVIRELFYQAGSNLQADGWPQIYSRKLRRYYESSAGVRCLRRAYQGRRRLVSVKP
jgi:acyl-CoA thioesterase I